MDSIAHGDVMESIPIVVEDESDKSSQIGRGMRIKKMSLVLKSPFTNPEKRRKLHNVNAFDPFRELDPAKADDLQNWLVNAPDRSNLDGSIVIVVVDEGTNAYISYCVPTRLCNFGLCFY
ncbi:Hypothetical predicted protein [Olea europaea subsp. europaea]|uniref:Uncharacterized protein n=1 Tax=Olea europaea subsp. europaea TaxID=158383 RepID=A0A8S0RLN4_OLEEU|nr:Hypothetical predicted protein [Olea europaea subsp. europaea]